MIIQLVTDHPEAILQILRHTPVWVWGLLVTLLAVGARQMRSRQEGLRRVFIMPLGMMLFGLSGIWADLGHNAQGGISVAPLLAWALSVTTTALLLAPFASPAGTRFDASANRFDLPASVQPLVLILAIFLTKYTVGIELALQPALGQDLAFTLPVSLLYGVFNGIFVARALRLWRMRFTHTPEGATGQVFAMPHRLITQRDPW